MVQIQSIPLYSIPMAASGKLLAAESAKCIAINKCLFIDASCALNRIKTPIRKALPFLQEMNFKALPGIPVLLAWGPVMALFLRTLSPLPLRSVFLLLNLEVIKAVQTFVAPFFKRFEPYFYAEDESKLSDFFLHNNHVGRFYEECDRLMSPPEKGTKEFVTETQKQMFGEPFGGIPLALLPEEDTLPKDKKSYDLLLDKQFVHLELFFAENNLLFLKANGLLRPVLSPTLGDKVRLVAGFVAIVALEIIHKGFLLYFLNYVGFSLEALMASAISLGTHKALSTAVTVIRKHSKIDQFMQLRECKKTLEVHQALIKGWEDRFGSYQEQLDANNSGYILEGLFDFIAKRKSDIEQDVVDFQTIIDQKWGWLYSPLFTTSPDRSLLREIIYPDPVPLPLVVS